MKGLKTQILQLLLSENLYTYTYVTKTENSEELKMQI